MKYKLFSILFLLFFVSFFKPQNVFSCFSASDCSDLPPSGCSGESVSCDNGQCNYTWQCSGDCVGGWTSWSPDPCQAGDYQSRDCTGSGLYQIQQCGGGGGGGPECYDGNINCPANWFRTNVIDTSVCRQDNEDHVYCGSYNSINSAGQQMCAYATGGGSSGLGSSQLETGCYREGAEGGCPRQHQVTSYTCCPNGTTSVLTPGSNYTRNNSCFTPTVCSGQFDTYVSHYNSASAGTCACNCSDDRGCGPNCDKREGSWVYNVITTCQETTASCVPNCNTTAPSGINYTSSNQTLTWTAGSNGTSQRLYVSTLQSDVTNDCGAGTNCVVSNSNATSPTTLPSLTAATTYYVKIVNYKDSSCSSSTNYSFVTPIANTPWWQIKDGDVTTNGDISSTVPVTKLFDIVGLGGYPGVPVYGGNLSVGTGAISTTQWSANTTTIQSRIFNYSYFKNLIPDDIIVNDINNLTSGSGATADEDGYEWYKITGNLDTVGNIDLGTRKVILLIESGNLNIGGKINLTDNSGFFGAFVNGSIAIDPAVTGSPSIEGIYLADSNFSTGAGSVPLHVRGSVAVYGSTNLQRDLVDDASPAELFEFAPDQMFLFPESLAFRRIKWAEIAP